MRCLDVGQMRPRRPPVLRAPCRHEPFEMVRMVSRLVSVLTVAVRMFAKTPDFVNLQRAHNLLNIATILGKYSS